MSVIQRRSLSKEQEEIKFLRIGSLMGERSCGERNGVRDGHRAGGGISEAYFSEAAPGEAVGVPAGARGGFGMQMGLKEGGMRLPYASGEWARGQATAVAAAAATAALLKAGIYGEEIVRHEEYDRLVRVGDCAGLLRFISEKVQERKSVSPR